MLKSVDCIVLQFEIPLETVYYTVAFARRHGIRCILNPAPAQAVDMAALKDLDYFVPNEHEAETIIGVPVKTVEDARQCAEKLVAAGIRRVIITLGANGAFLASGDGGGHVAPFTVNCIDSTGAGDAFIGSFAVFLGEGVPEKKRFAVPICMRRCPRRESVRRSRSTIARASMRSGESEHSHVPRPFPDQFV